MTWGSGAWGAGAWGAAGDTDPPVFQNQSPAPDATGVAADVALYAEVYDAAGNLDPTTVDLYVNDTLAWRNDRALPGFAGSRVAVTDGYGYTLQPAEPFEAGVQTIRGTAQDTEANAMDESYSFTTRALLVTDEDVEQLSDQATGLDLYLDTSHDLELEDLDLRLVAGADEVAQHLRVGLRLFLGEWFLDDEAGMPYYRDVFVAAPSSRVVETVFRQEILSDQDIEQIRSFDMEIDRLTRKLDVAFTAVSSVGIVQVDAVFP